MIPKEAREELRALEKKASPAPWEAKEDCCPYDWKITTADPVVLRMSTEKGDAAFIAHMRNALIPLLDYVDALEAVEQAARRCRERYKMEFHSDGDSHALCEALAALDKVRP